MNPIAQILNKFPVLILDGAFATELEKRGHNLDDSLWSAKILMESPEEIAAVHDDYFKAGADCVITASYQATYEGFMRKGLSERKAEALISSSVKLAKDTRDRFWADPANRTNRPRPLVAASVGSYGAYLADGSEYRGDYAISESDLADFHRRRWHTLTSAGPDILACETIPCLAEARAFTRLLAETPEMSCWMSFSARDESHISNGEPITACARFLNSFDQVAAIGINCTTPRYIDSLIEQISRETDKPIIVYPNGGEAYDALAKIWTGSATPPSSYPEWALHWYDKGARVIGGCCRTTPDHIRSIASRLKEIDRPEP